MARMLHGTAFAGALIAVMLAAPAAASAVDRYVDAENGSDLSPCSQAAPCETIVAAATPAKSDPGDRILIDNGSYPGTVNLDGGRSLVYSNWVSTDGDGPAIADGADDAAVVVGTSGAGDITGLTLRSDSTAVTVEGPVDIESNTFDDPDGPGSVTGVYSNAEGVEITGNTFIDPAPDSTRARLAIFGFQGPVIRDNAFIAQNIAIQASGNNTHIEGNEISQTHDQPYLGFGILISSGANVTIRDNEITDAATSGVTGIYPRAGNTLERNEVSGQSMGVRVNTDETNVTLTGDRLWDNGVGIEVFDNGAAPPQSSATLTNVTVVENELVGISNQASALTINSTIADTISYPPTATCTISFSRADLLGVSPTGCNGWQTNADPMLVDPQNGDLHLQAGSPMIDTGDPSDPPLGFADFDGDLRALDATPECSGNVNRRDIGADEFLAETPDCIPPDTVFTKKPPRKTAKRTVKFRFQAQEPATFSCQLDDKPAFDCASPQTFGVSRGRHRFSVTATDTAGNIETEAAKHAFRRTG